MKRLIAVMVAVGICGFYWFGCKKSEVPAPVTEEAVIEEEVTVTPAPPAPEEAEEGEKTPEEMGE